MREQAAAVKSGIEIFILPHSFVRHETRRKCLVGVSARKRISCAKSLTGKLGLRLILLISEGVFWEGSWMLILEPFGRDANLEGMPGPNP